MGDSKELFFKARLLSMAALLSVAIGQQQVGVSLVLLGKTIPNNSLVNFDDLLYRLPGDPPPSNANGLQTLMCATDLVECCEIQQLGNWYYPDGRIISFEGSPRQTFLTNRGQNEVIHNQQFYGSVRLWRRYSPQERGIFRCELPDANNAIQILSVNILFFSRTNNVSVAISPSGSTTAGESYSLTCFATLHIGNPPLPDPNIPSPTFEWFFGPSGNDPLPSGLIPTATILNSNTYTSTLQFSPLSQTHTGNYTCQLGAGSLVNSSNLAITSPSLIAVITADLNPPLMVGQTGHTLTCDVSGAEMLSPTIAYQWTRNDGSTQTQVGNLRTLTLPPLTLSSAGEYSCHATVSSALLTSDGGASIITPQRVEIQIPDLHSITVTSSPSTIVLCVSTVTVTCTVELGPAVRAAEVPLLMVDAQLFRDGVPLKITGSTVNDTTVSFSTTVKSFSESDVGNYTCIATVRPGPSSVFLTGMGQLESSPFELTIGAQSSVGNTGCTANEIAITVVVTILIECLLAAPVIAAVLVLCWKRNQRKIPTTVVQGNTVKSVMEEVYEDPDKIAATAAPGKFELADCPAYVPTVYPDKLQPCMTTETSNSDYEL